MSERIGEHKNYDVPLSGSMAKLHIVASISSARLININLIDSGADRCRMKIEEKREREREIKMKGINGGEKKTRFVMPKRKFI